MLIAYIFVLIGLALALRTIEVGIAYAAWAGAGTLLIAVIGVVFVNESVTLVKVVSILLVLVGVIGLNVAASVVRH